MSGPKVVRIVTREEILAICHGHLARVDAALAEWERICGRNDCADDQAIAHARGRREALVALITADRFMDLQKQAPLEEAFLNADCQRRLADAVSAKSLARKKTRRQKEAATALLKALKSAGIFVEGGLEEALRRGDPAAASQAVLLLGSGKVGVEGDATLAAKLRDGSSSRSFEEWVGTHSAEAGDPAAERIETRIAEILQIEDCPDEGTWRARLTEAGVAPSTRGRLILDSLEVETGRALTGARLRADARRRLASALAVARAAGASIETDCASDAPVERIEEAIAAIEAAVERRREAEAVQARRAAVLEGLSGLGYEISEGMETMWASEGRLVVRSATRPDYGVELSGEARFQMKPVAFDGPAGGPDATRDRDAEVIWCGDAGALQQSLAAAGDNLVIEKSFPVGAVPLKRIATSGAASEEVRAAPVRRERTLK